MIVAERKPLNEIAEMIAPYKKVTVIGCRSCVAICLAGGEKVKHFNLLYALEGAIRGVRWHLIPREERDALRQAVEQSQLR